MNNSFNDFLDYATSRLDYLDHLNNYIEKSAGGGSKLKNIAAEVARKKLIDNVAKHQNAIETRALGTQPGSKVTTVSESRPLSTLSTDINLGRKAEVDALDNSINALSNVIKTAPKDTQRILRQQLKDYKKLRSDIASGAVQTSPKFSKPEHGLLDTTFVDGYEPKGYADVLSDAAERHSRAVAGASSDITDTARDLSNRLFTNGTARYIHEFAKLNPDPSKVRFSAGKPLDAPSSYGKMHPAYAHYRGLSELHRRAVQSGDRNLANIYKKLMDESEWGRAEAIGNNAITDLLNGKKPTGKPLGEYSDNRLEAIIRMDMDENEALFREGLRNKEMYEVMKARYQRNLDRVAPSPVGKIEAEIHHLDLLHSKGVIKSKDYKAKRAELDKQLNEAKENAKYDITPEEVRPVPEEVAPAPAPEPTPAPAPTSTAPKPLEPTPTPAPGEAPVPGSDPLPVNTKAKPEVPSFNPATRIQIEYSKQQIAKAQERISEINMLIGKYGSGDDVTGAINEKIMLQGLIKNHEEAIAKLSGGSSLPPTRPTEPIPPTEPGVPPTRPTEPIPPTEPGVPPTKPTEPVPPTEPGVPPTKTGEPAPTETGVPPTKTGEPVPPTESGVPPTESTPEVKPPFSAGTAAAVLAALGGGGVAAYNFWPSGDGGGDLSEGGSISPQVREIINNVANADSAELAAARDEIARLRNRPDMSQMSFLERLLFLIFGQHYLDVLGGLTK